MSVGGAARRRLTASYDRSVSGRRPSADAPVAVGDPASRRWVEQLHPGHPRHEHAVAKLHDILRRAALHELHRRRGQLGSLAGIELEDVAQQCADDAMMNILAKLDDFQGLSRFTTWAYKFVIFEVSSKLARHAWQRHPPSAEDLTFDQLPDTLAARPGEQAERREQLAVLSARDRGGADRRASARSSWRSRSTTCRSTCSPCSWSPTATRSTRTSSTPGASCAPAWPPPATRVSEEDAHA